MQNKRKATNFNKFNRGAVIINLIDIQSSKGIRLIFPSKYRNFNVNTINLQALTFTSVSLTLVSAYISEVVSVSQSLSLSCDYCYLLLLLIAIVVYFFKSEENLYKHLRKKPENILSRVNRFQLSWLNIFNSGFLYFIFTSLLSRVCGWCVSRIYVCSFFRDIKINLALRKNYCALEQILIWTSNDKLL